MHTAKQLGCNLPIYLESATDFLYEGNAKFNEKSIVVIASLSGNTIEIEQAIDKAHEVGAKVIGYVSTSGIKLTPFWCSVLTLFSSKFNIFLYLLYLTT